MSGDANSAAPILTAGVISERRKRAWLTRRAKYGPAGHSGIYSRAPSPVVLIDNIGGFCPVQAEGTVSGLPFYFRARGQRWTIGIGGDPVCDPSWFYEEAYGDEPYDAGWMGLGEARRFIAKAVRIFASGSASSRPSPPVDAGSGTSTPTQPPKEG